MVGAEMMDKMRVSRPKRAPRDSEDLAERTATGRNEDAELVAFGRDRRPTVQHSSDADECAINSSIRRVFESFRSGQRDYAPRSSAYLGENKRLVMNQTRWSWVVDRVRGAGMGKDSEFRRCPRRMQSARCRPECVETRYTRELRNPPE